MEEGLRTQEETLTMQSAATRAAEQGNPEMPAVEAQAAEIRSTATRTAEQEKPEKSATEAQAAEIRSAATRAAEQEKTEARTAEVQAVGMHEPEAQTGKRPDLRTYSPLTLAYLGDAVYEVFIRTELLKKGNRPTEKLHREAIRYVKASEQAKQIAHLEQSLTAEERDIYRRGCNAKPHTLPKHADPTDYHHATGYETLLGWLSLKGDMRRANELMQQGLQAVKGILS